MSARVKAQPTGVAELFRPAPALRVHELHVELGDAQVINGVELSLERGQTLAIVGESGAGKSMTARAVMGLLPRHARVTRGSVEIDGHAVITPDLDTSAAVRGKHVGMVFQNPLRSLNPTMRVGAQIAESLRIHLGMSRVQARRRTVELLELVRIPSAAQRYGDYPHQLSGGMRQRVVIAMALACTPPLLIADEPTTALDVTTQAEILTLLAELQADHAMAVVLVTHDIRIASQFSDLTAVMYAGRIVELGPTAEVVGAPRMPYTRALLDTVPRPDQPKHSPLAVIGGRPPDLTTLGAGCAFAPRCALASAECGAAAPPLTRAGAHSWLCWHSPGERADV